MSKSVDAGNRRRSVWRHGVHQLRARRRPKPPDNDTVQGWVTFFWQQLRFELTNAGVPQAGLWLDRYEIEPAEDFTKKIEVAIHHAKLVLIVLSPTGIQRPWCLKEVTYFAELHPDGQTRPLSSRNSSCLHV